MNRPAICISMFVAYAAHAQTFNRQAFLTAVKDRLKTQGGLMEPTISYDPLLQLAEESTGRRGRTVGDPGSAWQKDLVNIPDSQLRLAGQRTSFGIALAYLAS